MVECMSAFLNCDDIGMYVLNKQFELFTFIFNSIYVDLKYNMIALTFITGSVYLCGVCCCVVVLGMYVSLSWYPMWMRWSR